MSAEYQEQQLQALPHGAQPFARRLLTLGRYKAEETQYKRSVPEDQRTQDFFDHLHQEEEARIRNVANMLFDEAAFFKQQLDEAPTHEGMGKATALFMLNLLYADQYGRTVAYEKMPNMHISITRNGGGGESLTEQSANLVTMTIANPDKPAEVIILRRRFYSLVQYHNKEFPTPLDALGLNRLLRKSGAVTLDEESLPDRQEPLYRRAEEILQIDKAVGQTSLSEAEIAILRARKIVLVDELLTARAEQLAHEGQADFHQTVFLGLLRADRVGRRNEYYDLLELRVAHPTRPNQFKAVHFLPLRSDKYTVTERRLLQPKIIPHKMDFEDIRER